jgi:hypothetical protein
VPNTLHDPDFCGIESHREITCDHFEKLERFVAFEGVNTGRRFLGCAREVSNISVSFNTDMLLLVLHRFLNIALC